MLFKDYYKILGLSSNRVDKNQIKMAYREQAKKYHPDVNNSRNEERFKDINEAYRVLSDSASKRKYDRLWYRTIGRKNASYEESKREKGALSSDFFNMFFGNVDEVSENNSHKHSAKKGENIETEINISIKDAFKGVEQTVGIRSLDGKIKKFKVKIPSGIQNNEKIRLAGQGKVGSNGGKNGDLFIKVKIDNDAKFSLEKCDVKTDLCITPWEAALGKKITINGLDEDVLVYVPAGIQSGEKIEIEDRGYKYSNGTRGKLILETKIMIPKNLNKEELKLFQKLNELSNFNPRLEP